jgi:hypothetical protein
VGQSILPGERQAGFGTAPKRNVPFERPFVPYGIQPSSLAVLVRSATTWSESPNRARPISRNRTMSAPPVSLRRGFPVHQHLQEVKERHPIDAVGIMLRVMGVVGVMMIQRRFQLGQRSPVFLAAGR